MVFYSEEKKGYIILDYKSNHISAKKVPVTLEKYKVQLLIYAQAIKKIFKQYPVFSGIYFLVPEQDAGLTQSELKRDWEELINSGILASENLFKTQYHFSKENCAGCEFAEICKSLNYKIGETNGLV